MGLYFWFELLEHILFLFMATDNNDLTQTLATMLTNWLSFIIYVPIQKLHDCIHVSLIEPGCTTLAYHLRRVVRLSLDYN